MTEERTRSSVDTRPPPLGLRRDGLDPDPAVTAMRERGGTCPATTHVGYVVTLLAGYDDARRVHADPAFSVGTVPAVPGVSEEESRRRRRGFLLSTDPPDHTRMRSMLTRRFTQRAMRALEPRIEAIVDDAVTAMVAGGPPADLVADLALPVPSLVICELLGVPYADRDEFQDRARSLLAASLTPAERVRIDDEARAYMGRLVARARREGGDDLLGMLVEESGGRPAAEGGIDDDELVGLANLLLVAGHETTSNVITLGTVATLSDPVQADLLHAAVTTAEDGDAAPLRRAVEELLRWVTPVSAGFPRRVTEDVAVGSHVLEEGTIVSASLCAANRDPALGPDLDRLDLAREPVAHVAFGHGIHFCLGAPLARMELAIVFRTLLRRLPGLALAVDPAELTFRPDALIHGVESLPVTW